MIGVNLKGLGNAVEGRVQRYALLRWLRFLAGEIEKDDVLGLSAQVAYGFIFAIFPMMLLLAMAISFVGDALGMDGLFDQWVIQVSPFLPTNVSSIVDSYLKGLLSTPSRAFLTLGIVGTLWGAMAGVGTMIHGLGRAYHVHRTRPFWQTQLLALVITITLPPVGVLMLVLAVLGRNVAASLGGWLGLGQELVNMLSIARWPLLVLVLFLGLSFLYHLVPYKQHRYVWSLPGSAVATVGWLLLTQAFGMYLDHFTNFGTTYGNFSAAIAFLLWLYLVGFLVLLGAEINGHLEPVLREDGEACGSSPDLMDEPSA